MKRTKKRVTRNLRGVIAIRNDATKFGELFEKLNKAFDEFKASNDSRLKQIEAKGVADPLTEEKVNKINADITALTNAIKAVELKAAREQAIGASDPKQFEQHRNYFTQSVMALAQRVNRSAPSEISAEQFDKYRAGFDKFLRMNMLTPDLQNSLMVGSDPDGGYLCPPEIDLAIDRVVVQLGAMRTLATIRQIGAVSLKKYMTTTGAGAGGWGTESTQPTETTTPKIAELEFVPGLLWAEPRATSQMLEDSVIDAEAWLADEVGLTFSEQEAGSFISGNGVNRPRGILSYPTVLNSSYAWGSIGYTKTGAAAAFAATNPSDNLMDLIHSLKRQYRQGGSFVMNDLTLATIRKFKDGQGIYLWAPSGLQGGQVGVLLGYPVATDDFMDDLGANKFPVAFSDFRRSYIIVDRRGTSVIRDNLTAKPWVKFYTTRRVGGGIQNYEAIKLLKCEA